MIGRITSFFFIYKKKMNIYKLIIFGNFRFGKFREYLNKFVNL